MPTVTTTQTTEVQLKPALKLKLLRRLKVYAELRTQLKTIEAVMDKEKAELGKLREEAGVNSLALDGFHVSLVTSTRKTLSKEKLMEMGVTVGMLEEATVTKAGRPYEKVTCPGERQFQADE